MKKEKGGVISESVITRLLVYSFLGQPRKNSVILEWWEELRRKKKEERRKSLIRSVSLK